LKALTRLNRVFDGILVASAFFSCFLLTFALLSVNAEILMRYLGRPIIWATEVSEYILLYIGFLAAAWVLKREGHVKMDLVIKRLKPGAQAMFNLIISVVGVITFAFVVWYGTKVTWDYCQRGMYTSGAMTPPEWPILLVIPLGGLLLLIQFVIRAWGYLGQWRGRQV